MQRGKFITIEGIEGVGKSTNITYIQHFLTAHNIGFITTREPGGTPLAEEVRQLLLLKRQETVNGIAELLLMFGARAQHVYQKIQPSLEQGKWVLCDRFTDSSYAYQGGGRGLDTDLILQLEALVQQGLQPDLTFYLDIDAQQGLARASQRGALDRFENEQLDFFERVRKAYYQRVQQDPQRFVLIDASAPLDKVQQQIAQVLVKICEPQPF